jgi:hypothetical protein
MTVIALRSDIPLPRPRVTLGYPWQTMEVGQSFPFASHVKPESAWTYTWAANRTYAPKKFQCRKHEGEMRCWRVA